MNILNFEKQHMKEAAALALASYYEERRFVKELIRPMEFIDCKPCTDYDFVELPKTEYHFVYPLHLALNRHYCESPFFMNRRPETQEEFMAASMQEGVRYFVAKQGGKLCAFLKISPSGEAFVATGNSYRHITGAYGAQG